MSFSLRHLTSLLSLLQQTDTFFNQLLGSNSLTLRRLQVSKEIFILIHIMDNICPHGLNCFLQVERVSALPHKVLNSDYHLGNNKEIVIK